MPRTNDIINNCILTVTEDLLYIAILYIKNSQVKIGVKTYLLKWSHQIIEERKPHPDNCHHQMKAQVLGMGPI